jgi:hypothetical protein
MLYFERGVAIYLDDGKECHRINTSWAGVKSFSWSSDSSRVGFYFVEDINDEDLHMQKHGVAVLDTDGKLTVLQKPTEKLSTPGNPIVREVPPGWGKDGKYLYFSGGVTENDPRRQTKEFEKLFVAKTTPVAVYRVNLETRERQTLTLGEFTAASPTEDYILVTRFSRELGKRRITLRLDLDTQEMFELPEGVFSPQLSIDGTIAVCCFQERLTFFDTQTWTRISGPIDVSDQIIGCAPDDWYRDFKWIQRPTAATQEAD